MGLLIDVCGPRVVIAEVECRLLTLESIIGDLVSGLQAGPRSS
jgi:hypothetical protein